MPSPLLGVWELVSDTHRGFRIFTEGHNAGIYIRSQDRRRGFIASYSLQGNRLEADILVDTATTAPPRGVLEFQRDGDNLTLHVLTRGAVAPAGQVDVWRKMSDAVMTSPYAGVWQLISETDQSITVRTDTYWATVAIRGDFRRGIGGTYTVEGNRMSHAILFDTAADAPPQIDIEFDLEGDIFVAKRLAGTLSTPAGHVDRWRKI